MLRLSMRLIAACFGWISLRVDNMEPIKQITAAIFSAFVKCPTKAYLLASGEQKPDAYFTELMTRVSSAYKNTASRELRLGNGRGEICNFTLLLLRDQEGDTTYRHVDCDTAVYDLLS